MGTTANGGRASRARARRHVVIALAAFAATRARAQHQPPSIDRPRLLRITMRRDRPAGIDTGARAPGGAVVVDSRRAEADPAPADTARTIGTREQTMRVLEGARTVIDLESAIPLSFRHFAVGAPGVEEVRGTITYDGVVRFALRPRLAGDTVTLELEPQEDVVLAQPSQRGRLVATVRGRLGEWLAVGGADLRDEPDDRGAAGALRARTRPRTDQRGVWLKVDVDEERSR
jgi:hypothetical protein